MPRFKLTIDQNDAAFFGGLSLSVAGAALVAWPLVLVVAGAGFAAVGFLGTLHESARPTDRR